MNIFLNSENDGDLGKIFIVNISGLAQDWGNSIDNALELRESWLTSWLSSTFCMVLPWDKYKW